MMHRSTRTTLIPALALLAALFLPLPTMGGGSSDPLEDAQARIERYRKGSVTIVVRDSQQRPVPGAKVEVEQTGHEFLFGCNCFLLDGAGDATANRAYEEQFAALFNFATLPFYWPAYEPQRGQPRHAQALRTAQWCHAHGILPKGHPLVWNYLEVPWLPEDPKEIERLQLQRVDDCVRRLSGSIDYWDVVNEATHFDRPELVQRAPKLTGMWKAVGQVELTRKALAGARQANPQATLLINDYRTDDAYARVVEQLVDQRGRRLYDAIGIQSHMHGGVWPEGRLWEVCERFARFGVPLHFTELTILSGPKGWERPRGTWQSTPDGEAEQAREVERIYTLLFSHPAVAAITWWDLSDRGAWQHAPAGLLREDLQPKPAYNRLYELVRRRWCTRQTVQTNQQGQAEFRGFLGQYRIRVTSNGRETTRTGMRILKGTGRRWDVEF